MSGSLRRWAGVALAVAGGWLCLAQAQDGEGDDAQGREFPVIPAQTGDEPATGGGGDEANGPARVMVLPVRAGIDPPTLFVLRRGIKEAIDTGADTLVLDMETPGGRLDVTFDILQAMERFPGRTVTYINREAISAGALIAAGTDEIYFAPRGVVGSAAPVMMGGQEIDETMRAKIISYLLAKVRAMSEEHPFRAQVLSAMVDMNYELTIDGEVIKKEGELLALTASEAMREFGDPPRPLFGAGIAASLEELLDELHGSGNYEVVMLEVTWSERAAQYLTKVAPLLMGLGLLLLLIEFKTPGFGVFGVVGGVLMAVVFFGHHTAGLSGNEAILVFVLGAALVALELFLFPGTIVLALVGILMMLGALVWSMADIWPDEPIQFSAEIFLRPVIDTTIAVILAAVAFLLLVRYLPRGGPWGRLVLETSVRGAPRGLRPVVALGGFGGGFGGAEDENEVREPLTGLTGVATTALYPSGQVEIEGRIFEARVAVGMAERGAAVRVVREGEFGLEVEVIPS